MRTRENAAIDVVAEEFEDLRAFVRHPIHSVFHIFDAGRKRKRFHEGFVFSDDGADFFQEVLVPFIVENKGFVILE